MTSEPLKLTELEPRWCSEAGRHGMGLTFLCPVHRNHRLGVQFANPIDGGAAMQGQKYLWRRQGETFDALTLGPSIDASGAQHFSGIETPCWHGFIAGGEIK